MVDNAAPAADDLVASQASSHFQLQPITADVLLRRETKRRDALKERGPVKLGCRGVDEYVLMGGLERGSVVGISSESEQIGLLVSMQALAHELCGSDSSVMVVTAQPPAAILPTLRNAVKTELTALGVLAGDIKSRLRSCLERVSVSRVFDLDGLWEVLGDLDIPPGSPISEDAFVPEEDAEMLPSEGRIVEPQPHTERIMLPDLKPGPDARPKPARTEIADSDDEEAFSPMLPPSSSDLSELSPPPSSMASMLAASEPRDIPETSGGQEPEDEMQIQDALGEEPRAAAKQPAENQQARNQSPPKEDASPPPPDVILITHFSNLVTALFTRLDRTSAHNSLQSLSDYLRYLSRSLSTSPLIMLLNSTSSSKNETSTQAESSTVQNPSNIANGQTEGHPPPPPMFESPMKSGSRPIEQSLCSVFNPPALDVHGYNNRALSRRNKPTFGLVFSQFLDLHLLCTKVPRTKDDGEKFFANPVADDGQAVKFTWVVEVLLDEIGVWEEGRPQGARKCREQRWTPVEVTPGRIVDTFTGLAEKKKDVGGVRVVGGFGGPRV